MIALASDCLLFQTVTGETIPYSADMISVELMGETAELFDAEFVRHASHAVFHYFRHELGKKSVTVAEYAEALEKVLRGFMLQARTLGASSAEQGVYESDLARLACESGAGRELFFFPRLKDELRRQLTGNPRLLRFVGLRGCVKQIIGARRWTRRCTQLEEEIIDFLRKCALGHAAGADYSLLVH